jgi:hypothetical protein
MTNKIQQLRDKVKAEEGITRRSNAKERIREYLISAAPGNIHQKVRSLRSALNEAILRRDAEMKVEVNAALNAKNPLRAEFLQAKYECIYDASGKQASLKEDLSRYERLQAEESDPDIKLYISNKIVEVLGALRKHNERVKQAYEDAKLRWENVGGSQYTDIVDTFAPVERLAIVKQSELDRIPAGAKIIHGRDGTLKYQMPGEAIVRIAEEDLGRDYPVELPTHEGQTAKGLQGKNTYIAYLDKNLRDQRKEALDTAARLQKKAEDGGSPIKISGGEVTEPSTALTPEENEAFVNALHDGNTLEMQIGLAKKAGPLKRSQLRWKLVPAIDVPEVSSDRPITKAVLKEIEREKKAAQEIAKEDERRQRDEERRAAKREAIRRKRQEEQQQLR